MSDLISNNEKKEKKKNTITKRTQQQQQPQSPQSNRQQQNTTTTTTTNTNTKRPGIVAGGNRADPRTMPLSSSVSASASSSTASFPGDSSSTFVSASPFPTQSPPQIHHLPTLPHLPQLPQLQQQQQKPHSPQTNTDHHHHQQRQHAAIDTNEDVTDEYKLLLSPMFAAMSKITEHLFLTGVGGMTKTNFRRNHIDFVVNITTEAPFWENTESMRLPLEDDVSANILPYLNTAVDRINDAIIRRGAHVLVHCIAGVSRSATVVIAYLMKYKRMDLRAAFNYCYNLRPIIRPNNGFMQQLISYELELFGRNSVWMTDVEVDGTQVKVPQFFIEEHHKLVLLEIMRVRAMSKPQGQGTTTTTTTTSSSPPNQPPPPPGAPGHQATT